MCKKVASCLQPGVSWHMEIDENITECVNCKHPVESSLKKCFDQASTWWADILIKQQYVNYICNIII